MALKNRATARSANAWRVNHLGLNGKLPFESSELIGYASMVPALLFVFFGIRSYRESTGGGFITFGKAFKVGVPTPSSPARCSSCPGRSWTSISSRTFS